MCIIIYKKDGVPLPSDKVLSTCLRTHKDGFGAMWRDDDNKVVIHKGLFDLPQIKRVLSQISTDTEAAFHFRQATHGNISAENCHPFPLSCRNDALTATTGTFDTGLMHNGIIYGFGNRTSSTMSDTMNFIKHLEKATGKIYTFDRLNHHIKKGYGKFIIFTPEWTYSFGDFVEDNKLKFSNSTYKDWPIFNSQNEFSNYGKGLGRWNSTLKKYVFPGEVGYEDKPKIPAVSAPLVAEVDPTNLVWREGTEIATYRGRFGHVIEYKGSIIFCEIGYDENELTILKDDINVAILEGEYECMGNLAPTP